MSRKGTFLVRELTLGMVVLGMAGCRRPSTLPTSFEPISVAVAQPQRRTFRQAVRAHGIVQSKVIVRVTPLVPGRIDELNVDEGDRVEKGQVLFQTDRVTLEHNVRIAEDNLRVARASVRDAETALADARVAARKAEADLQRAQALYEKDRAIPLDALERAETTAEHARAMVARAEAALDLAKAREQQAVTSLEIARKQFDDSVVRAPLRGVVTRRLMRAGEFGTPGTPVLVLESTEQLEVSFYVSEQHYAAVLPGTSTVTVVSETGQRWQAPVRYRAPSVQSPGRIVEVRADLPAEPHWVPGRPVQVELELGRRENWGVPEDAVSLRAGTTVVFVVRDGVARALPVRTAWRTDGYVELIEADELARETIVIEGQSFLNDGVPVRVR